MPDKIAVVGLGQIGGSIVLALRKNGFAGHIHGIDISAPRRNRLKQSLDSAAGEYNSADFHFIFVCLHFRQTIEFLKQVEVGQETLIIDCCSGKQKICRLAERRKLPFLGGHPMAGNEKQGEKGWDADLFQGKIFFLCPILSTRSNQIRRARQIIRTIGAKPVMFDAESHDRFVAETSHFPAFLSLMLRDVTADVPALFQGPGFRSMTRLSNTSKDLQQTFLDSNGANILRVATDFRRVLDRWIRSNT